MRRVKPLIGGNYTNIRNLQSEGKDKGRRKRKQTCGEGAKNRGSKRKKTLSVKGTYKWEENSVPILQ